MIGARKAESIAADVARVNAWVAAREATRPRLSQMTPADIRALFEWAPWPDDLRAVGDPECAPLELPPGRHVERVALPREGAADALEVTVLTPPGAVRGVYFYVHGGGWMSCRTQDYLALLWPIATRCGVVVVMPEYRLAPEHPFPRGPDDCEQAARWTIASAAPRFDASVLLIGGDSAGAHLALSTLLRIRDAGAMPFRGIDLLYGCYDLSGTPSLRRNREDTLSITRSLVERCVGWFAGLADLRDPELSPLYAALGGLPPALISVGTHDPLYDDSAFLAARWQAANGNATFEAYAGGHHSFDCYPTSIARRCYATRCAFIDAHLRR